MELKNIGITTAKEKQFNSKEIYTVEDLAQYMPRKYLDFRRPANVSQVVDKEICSIVVTIYDIITYPDRIAIKGRDIEGGLLFVNYFGSTYIANILTIGDTVVFCGQVNVGFNRFVSMANPISFSKNLKESCKIMPVYSKIQGMSNEYLTKSIENALNALPKYDYLESEIKDKFNLIDKDEAIRIIHNPSSFEELEQAHKRLLFDDMFKFDYELAKDAREAKNSSEFILKSHDLCSKYINELPFRLTSGQNSAIREAYEKTLRGERLNMLVEGDVGCGKTEVAKVMALNAVNNGYQVMFLAPTNVLATQHYNDLSKSFESLDVSVGFLTGDTKKKDRKELLEKLAEGEIDILIGTHAVLSDDVIFKNLALTIVDEEHKFGVNQKEKLRQKGAMGVHSISLSATPIPRTLAKSIYGGAVDVAVINEKPAGRNPIATAIYDDIDACYQFIEEVVGYGQQAYIVCPVIEENDNIESVETAYKDAKEHFEPLGITTGMISGKMKQSEIADIVSRFANKEFDVLVSTTIIEVGVNVPNATLMLIKSAERFGLAQLHQLRGRVGRGNDQSYCVLYPGIDLDDESKAKAKEKLSIMQKTCDGFLIAEEDLKLRGTGDLIGTNQTGENKYVLLIMQNRELDEEIKKVVEEILNNSLRKAHYDKFLRESEID